METTIKNILLLVHDDVGQEARLQAALDVTRAVGGHLSCVDVTQLPVMYGAYSPPAGAMLVQDEGAAMLLEDEYAREGVNRHRIEGRLVGEGVSWDWTDMTADMAEAIIGAADIADLIVLNRKLDAFPGPDARGITGAVLMRAHKPVLAVPDALKSFRIAGRAIIAWDGSTAATDAVRACVSLLHLASEVRLLCVETGDSDTYLDDAASYLSRYGIRAELHRVLDKQRSPAEVILEECTDWNTDWCVMGPTAIAGYVKHCSGVLPAACSPTALFRRFSVTSGEDGRATGVWLQRRFAPWITVARRAL